MTDALNPKRKQDLSSYLDQETGAEAEFQQFLTENFSAQVHYRNLESVSRACQQHGAPIQEHDDFLSRLMGKIDTVEQESEYEDPECLSAWLDGQQELESAQIEASEYARTRVQNMRGLSAALQALPQPQAPEYFVTQVMEAVDHHQSPSLETLSAFYDHETQFQAVHLLDSETLNESQQTHLQNFASLSQALAHLNVPQAKPEFSAQVMAALLPQEGTETEDFESLSALLDGETNFETPSHPNWQNLQRLSQALQTLPNPEAPAGFAAQVMQAIDGVVDFAKLSASFDGENDSEPLETEARWQDLNALSKALQNLPQPQAPADFAAQVMQTIDQRFDFAKLSEAYDQAIDQASNQEDMELYQTHPRLKDLQCLSQALQHLPQFEAPEGFAQRVLAAAEEAPDFQTLSAYYDGALEKVECDQLETVLANGNGRREWQQLQTLSQALKALPQPEAPSDFTLRVMLATEQTHKKTLFALPSLLRTRAGQLVAGLALFGVLVLLSQTLLKGTEEIANVPGNQIVQVKYQAEDMLFQDVLDDSLENNSELDYNLLIGG